MKHLVLATILGLTLTHIEARVDHKNKEVRKECSEKAGMVKGSKTSKEMRQQFRQCLVDKGVKKEKKPRNADKNREAMKACRKEAGLERKKGEKPQKPDAAKQAKFKACLDSKGVKSPQKKG